MAIYVTGDTHGADAYGPHSFDGYRRRFSTDAFPEQKELTKEDYIIICGDFGGVWSTDRIAGGESSSEKASLDWLDARPFTTLFVPGNHENYDRLMGCRNQRLMDSWFYSDMTAEAKASLRLGYPRMAWNGGHVRCIRPSVLMLERGEIFQISGKSCFAFGGARSHDIQDGILDPADYPDEESFALDYQKRRTGMIRVRGFSWWDEEMPTSEEMDYGRQNIRAYMASHGKIDYVFTHEAPASDKLFLTYADTDEFSRYLESLRDIMNYGKWFYGHLHDNRRVFENHYLLYEQIIRIC